MYVILGPTASGKSALAMALARRHKGEILSVDSMQVYRDMDIGTAKPTAEEQAEIRHHLIDLLTPDAEFTVARFVELADAVIAGAAARGVPLIATGGTPLYYKALFEGLFEGPGADDEIRRRLAEQTNEALHARLLEVDPAAGARIHVNDHKRLVRALEVFELTGQPISSFQTHWTSPQPRHAATWIGLDWEKEAINRRINARTKAMLSAGWVDEVRTLLAKYPTLSKTAGEATGYRELIDHVQGKISLDDAFEQIKIATRQLARRQMKWFRRFPGVRWTSGDVPAESLVNQVVSTGT
ncbi:tRNA (adenosine(37)-N6)-dimethylallyltransferase MiaA [Humisphaera borealis]|uniref:tRNA dimethylallyltransferase n=1 Tax=Humisphaera borealis TaxID=2807512 RepID=A0A7M2WSI1_9BACT|nr:tRNA (adenosine(37)-N6)-dimethylallyltransferase MiaA [Humisphaera borealis]QOV88234.1 tRNA (adenosine(37)-N6)-dimethylallyltransferase MiaA [Humisphaera borealis]